MPSPCSNLHCPPRPLVPLLSMSPCPTDLSEQGGDAHLAQFHPGEHPNMPLNSVRGLSSCSTMSRERGAGVRWGLELTGAAKGTAGRDRMWNGEPEETPWAAGPGEGRPWQRGSEPDGEPGWGRPAKVGRPNYSRGRARMAVQRGQQGGTGAAKPGTAAAALISAVCRARGEGRRRP